MIYVGDFLSALLAIEEETHSYRTGGIGADGTCDCIGATMGAMYKCGHKKYDLHSSNYFARYRTNNLKRLYSEADCYVGMEVYKAREDAGELNERYKEGGRYYTGDLLDYYHAGVVISKSPFCVLHCTSGGGVDGFTRDYKLGQWNYGGQIMGIEYAVDDTPSDEEGDNLEVYVYADNGKTVNMRNRKSTTGVVVAKIPIGEKVTVLGRDEEWTRIKWGDKIGYVMGKFLRNDLPTEGSNAGEADEQDATIASLLKQAIALLDEAMSRME